MAMKIHRGPKLIPCTVRLPHRFRWHRLGNFGKFQLYTAGRLALSCVYSFPFYFVLLVVFIIETIFLTSGICILLNQLAESFLLLGRLYTRPVNTDDKGWFFGARRDGWCCTNISLYYVTLKRAVLTECYFWKRNHGPLLMLFAYENCTTETDRQTRKRKCHISIARIRSETQPLYAS